MNEEEATALQAEKAALETENARLKETLLLREAQDIVTAVLTKVEMPDLTRARLTTSLAKSPPVKEGKLDAEVFTTAIQEAIKGELEYIASVSGKGQVTGMGSSGGNGDDKGKLKESFQTMYLRQGMTHEEAEKLATLAIG